MYFGLLKGYMSEVHEEYISNPVACRFVIFMGILSLQYSVWLIAAVTVDRYIFTVHPLHHARLQLTRTKSLILMAAILCVLCIIDFHFFFTVTSESVNLNYGSYNETIYKCAAFMPNITQGFQIFWGIFDGAIYSYVPLVVLMTLNVLIIRALRQARRNVSSMNRANSREVKVTIMLMTISFVFLLTTTPVTVLMLTYFIGNNLEWECWEVRYNLLKTITQMLMYTNHSINFFLYLVSGQKFRQEFCVMFKLMSAQTVYSSLRKKKAGNDVERELKG